ncbi:argininosuccinate lyase [Nonomuraea sp. KM88]|uniref:argininosuccinate lyase n=1 Tax=Nonomuraea sp. KM88 TaxID=3457427 RepID=UPI003FCCE396
MSSPTTSIPASSPTAWDSGRLKRPVCAAAQEILFDRHLRPSAEPVAAELQLISQVDRAHLVMLVEQGIAAPEAAQRLLEGIERLRKAHFGPLIDLPAPRGRYLAYESYLIDTLGPDVGGILHSGRSRNDLNATVIRLRLREPYDRLLAECDLLGRRLLSDGRRYAAVTMPAYTHHQPAVPITYGHYLVGVAAALVRDMADLWNAGEEIEQNPLGAGAVGGTSLPIDPRRTTRLLGFSEPLANSVHAVASRDVVLRLTSAAAVLGVLLCRVAHDVQHWSSVESGLLHLADDVVGSSSMMPQKRNPFLLEHVQGRATVALGAFTAAVSAMCTSRFTNAIAVGTEAVAHIWSTLEAATDAVVLLRLVLEGAEPDAARMRQSAVEGQTVATHLAERLVSAGMPFRSAHHRVGAIAVEALETGRPLEDVARQRLPQYGPAVWSGLDPDSVAATANYGGGPGPGALEAALPDVGARLTDLRRRAARRRRRWAEAAAELDAAVHDILTNHQKTA